MPEDTCSCTWAAAPQNRNRFSRNAFDSSSCCVLFHISVDPLLPGQINGADGGELSVLQEIRGERVEHLARTRTDRTAARPVPFERARGHGEAPLALFVSR